METHSPQELHPLAATLSRIAELDTLSQAEMGELEPGWFLATDFLSETSTMFEQGLARQAGRHPTMKQRTRGSYFIGEYAWYVPAAAVATYLAERRVPDMSPENLALRFNTYTWHEDGESGEAERIDVRFLSGRFAVLPDDPAADHPDAIILPDENALRDWLRTTLEAHMTPLIERNYAVTRLGRQAQWCLVADATAALFLYAGQGDRNEPRRQQEGLAFVKVLGSPMKNPRTGFVTLQYGDHCDTFRARGGCCLYYTVAEDGEKCSTCVLRSPEERDAIILGYMKERYSQESAS
jgi:hypothetical protein